MKKLTLKQVSALIDKELMKVFKSKKFIGQNNKKQLDLMVAAKIKQLKSVPGAEVKSFRVIKDYKNRTANIKYVLVSPIEWINVKFNFDV